MRTLIIPDLHHHPEKANHWLITQKYDRVVYLGDYFDHFCDKVDDARRMALWLRERMKRPDDVFLLGNHDAAYMFQNSTALYCPGFTKEKSSVIHEILAPEHWDRFQLAHAEQGWLMSHAGFHPELIENSNEDQILEHCESVMDRVKNGVFDPLLGRGIDRGGSQPFGGLLWMDWRNLIPISGIHQVVGHTPTGDVRTRNTDFSLNICLDVQYASVAAILEEGELTVLRK